MVLTDHDLKILALQRNVNEGAPHEQIRAGSQYNLSERQNINGIPPMTQERIKDGLQGYIDRQAAGQQSTNKKLKKKPGDILRKALGGFINEYPPMLLDHALRVVGFDLNLQPGEIVTNQNLLNSLLLAMDEADALMKHIMSRDVVTGYVFGKSAPDRNASNQVSQARIDDNGNNTHVMYEDFHPFKPKHLEQEPTTHILEFEGYNYTIDEFFSSIEGQKLETRLAEKEATARRKLENARQDQEKRLGGLQQVQELNTRKAQAIEANLERVQEATAAVNGLIAQGMDWDEVGKLVELEQKRNNPVAMIMKLPLKLNENTVTLKLAEWNVENDDEDENDITDSEPSDSDEGDEVPHQRKTESAQSIDNTDKRLAVDVDLALSAWSNARDYYDQKRSAAVKEEKTLQASVKALKSTQRKVEADLKRALKQETQTLRPVRKPFWFEKFTYFITSDGYLVIGARDSQQSDTLYRKHLRNGDAWVHADLEGAMPCIIKNRRVDAPFPPSTLSQAGTLSVATSTAWDSKAVMSAWWVSQDQVTKKASTGDYLQPGRFEIKGDKYYLPPAQLLLGFAVLFQISESSKANHSKHRVQEDAPNESDAIPTQEPSAGDETVDREREHGSDAEGGIVLKRSNGDEDGSQDDNASEESESGQESGRVDDDDKDSSHYLNPLQTQLLNDEADGPSSNGEGDSNEENVRDDGEVTTAPKTTTQSGNTSKAPIPTRGKKGKKKKIAQKYADQDEEDRAAAMQALGSAVGQQKQKEQAEAKAEREREATAQRQRRREQHQKALERKAKQEEVADGDEDEDEDTDVNVDLDTLVGMPLPGDEILGALPICAPWGALGRCKYKAKLQPGSEKKGKAVRSILAKWGADAANKRNVDEKGEDAERIWPKEMEVIKSWKEAEVFGVVPVSKVRVMMSGASSRGGARGGSQQKQKKPSGKGSKKQR